MPRSNRKHHAASGSAGYANHPTQDELSRQAESSLPPHVRIGTAEESRTTVMWRNIPNNYTQKDIWVHVQEAGFDSFVDFFYAPRDMLNDALSGYVFLNFIASCHAEDFKEQFHGKAMEWKMERDGEVKAVASNKVSEVDWSNKHQGLEAHVERYRNSPVMYEVPGAHQPWLLKDGVVIPFPPPTKAPTKTMQYKTQPRSNWSRNANDRAGELPMDRFGRDSCTATELPSPAMLDSLAGMPVPMWQEGVTPAPAGSQQAIPASQLPVTPTGSSLLTAGPQAGVTPVPTGSQQALPAAPSLHKFCTSCGKQFPELAKFCGGCGFPRKALNATQQSQPDSFTPDISMQFMQLYMGQQVHGLNSLAQMPQSPESASPISCC